MEKRVASERSAPRTGCLDGWHAGGEAIGRRHEGRDQRTDAITRSLDRLTVSILLALLLIATGIYVLVGHFMGFDYYMVNILLGFLIASALGGARLLYGISRTRK